MEQVVGIRTPRYARVFRLELLAHAKFCSRLARVSSFHGCPFIDVGRHFVGRNDGCGLSLRYRRESLVK